MMEQAPVSVIIPCYRCTDTIGRAVASVAAQTLQPSEIVLVDDCSGDGTLKALRRLQTKYPDGWIRVITLSLNAGPATARNTGWDAASQPYIAFLDADDAWHPQKIEIQCLWMQAHPEVVLTGHACRSINGFYESSADRNHETSQVKFKVVSKTMLLASNWFPTSSVMLRGELSQRFLQGKRYCEDYLLWCEICCSGLLCYRSEMPFAYHFKAIYGAGGLSSDLRRMQAGELDVYQRLHAKEYYGFGTLVLVNGLSWLKYFRRILMVKFLRFGVLGCSMDFAYTIGQTISSWS